MPKFLENKLKAEYGAKSKIPYKVMNAMGVMRGNQETAKGRAMDKKHEQGETPKMEAKYHSKKFLKAAVRAKMTPQAASTIRAKAKKGMY